MVRVSGAGYRSERPALATGGREPRSRAIGSSIAPSSSAEGDLAGGLASSVICSLLRCLCYSICILTPRRPALLISLYKTPRIGPLLEGDLPCAPVLSGHPSCSLQIADCNPVGAFRPEAHAVSRSIEKPPNKQAQHDHGRPRQHCQSSGTESFKSKGVFGLERPPPDCLHQHEHEHEYTQASLLQAPT
jgi:hypothetical protein